jgi:hypothetical protein
VIARTFEDKIEPIRLSRSNARFTPILRAKLGDHLELHNVRAEAVAFKGRQAIRLVERDHVTWATQDVSPIVRGKSFTDVRSR